MPVMHSEPETRPPPPLSSNVLLRVSVHELSIGITCIKNDAATDCRDGNSCGQTLESGLEISFIVTFIGESSQVGGTYPSVPQVYIFKGVRTPSKVVYPTLVIKTLPSSLLALLHLPNPQLPRLPHRINPSRGPSSTLQPNLLRLLGKPQQ